MCVVRRHAAAVRRAGAGRALRLLRGAHAGALQPVRDPPLPAPRPAHAARTGNAFQLCFLVSLSPASLMC